MQQSATSSDNKLDIAEQEIKHRVILDGDVFELEAYSRDKEELEEEGYRLLNKGFTGVGLKTIRQFVVDETEIEGVYGLWIR